MNTSSSYYILTFCEEGVFEAYPVSSWSVSMLYPLCVCLSMCVFVFVCVCVSKYVCVCMFV